MSFPRCVVAMTTDEERSIDIMQPNKGVYREQTTNRSRHGKRRNSHPSRDF